MTFHHSAIVTRLNNTNSKFVYLSVGNVRCNLQPLTAESAQLYSIAFTKGSNCYLPITSDVEESDRLIIDGITYGVKGVKSHNYGTIRHKVAVLEEL